MAITRVIGFSGLAGGADVEDALVVAQIPLKPHPNLRSMSIDENSGSHHNVPNKNLLKTESSSGDLTFSSFTITAKDAFAPHHETLTRWCFGVRVRIISVRDTTDPNRVGVHYLVGVTEHSIFTEDDLTHDNNSSPTFYLEVMFDWETKHIRRWIDGYEISPLLLALKDVDASTVSIGYGTASTGVITSYWNDFYYLVDTNDDTPCTVLQGCEVEGLMVSDFVAGDDWYPPEEAQRMERINDTRWWGSLGYNPYVITDKNETSAQVSLAPRDALNGDVKFVQMSYLGHRLHGTNPTLHVKATFDTTEYPTVSEEMVYQNIKATQFFAQNTTPEGDPWTTESISQIVVDIHSTSGGGA